MENIRILWADDEIELLRSHILFLQEKGYEVVTTNSGDEALDIVKAQDFDIVFLDENMPGLSGLETLDQIKDYKSNIPVVMITKSEEESIMEDAIGSNIADYLIKPVNPNQILLCLKKNLEDRKIISEKATISYQQEFRNIGMEIGNNLDFKEWINIYKKLVQWELKLEKSEDAGIIEVLQMQKAEANTVFGRYIADNYSDWLGGKVEKPVLSHTLFKEKIFGKLDEDKPLYVLLIDNLRYDQWKAIQPMIEEYFRVENDDIFYSILPTATQYARNSMFSGLLPTEIQKKYPKYWLDENAEGSKNMYEKELLGELLKRYGKNIKYSYNKILKLEEGKKLAENLSNLDNNKLNVIVYNFIDMLSHARTEMEIIRELADDEPAYRSLMVSWFQHSSLFEIIKSLSEKNVNLIITTDHGSVQTFNPVKIIGDKNTNSNLRYKFGRMLQYDKKDVYEVTDPAKVFLPKLNVSTSYVFTKGNDFFVYPNNYNYYAKHYKNTFQHGGISLEEMLIPIISLKTK